MLYKSSENQFVRPKKKKKVVKIFENFLKIRPPPLKKILDPPLLDMPWLANKHLQRSFDSMEIFLLQL